jgi:TctA family transporter
LHSAFLEVPQTGTDLVAPLPVHRLGVDGLDDEVLRLVVGLCGSACVERRV